MVSFSERLVGFTPNKALEKIRRLIRKLGTPVPRTTSETTRLASCIRDEEKVKVSDVFDSCTRLFV
jgi:hypothetical protein